MKTPYNTQTRNSFLIIVIILSVIPVFLFTGCGPGLIGYGVVLWIDDASGIDDASAIIEASGAANDLSADKDASAGTDVSTHAVPFKNGELVRVVAESKIQDAYILYDEKNKKQIPVRKWRVEFFTSKSKAEKFAAGYREFSRMYGYSAKDGIPPVRAEALNSPDVKIICKPKAYQPVKIIGRSKEKAAIEDMSDYWYLVLMEYQGIGKDGEYQALGGRGYCFGYYLKLFETDSDPVSEISKLSLEGNPDDPLSNLMSNVWRPVYFNDMIASGKIDISVFSNSIGFFPYPEEKKAVIVTPHATHTFNYSQITTVDNTLYSFQGADLRIEIHSGSRISITYVANKEQVSSVYIKTDADIDGLVEREIQLRNDLYLNIYSHSHVLSSSGYGTITLKENKEMSWTGFEKLIPAVIPKAVSGKGSIDFPHYISKELRESYDGVITFNFKGYSPKQGVNFLYKIMDDGIRFMYVSIDSIKERRVFKTELNPLIIFFTFSEG